LGSVIGQSSSLIEAGIIEHFARKVDAGFRQKMRPRKEK